MCQGWCFLELMDFPGAQVFGSSFDCIRRTMGFWNKTWLSLLSSFLMLFWSGHAWRICFEWRRMADRGILLYIVLWLSKWRWCSSYRGQRPRTFALGLYSLLGVSAATGSSAVVGWPAVGDSKLDAWRGRWQYRLAWQEHRPLSFSWLDFDNDNSSITSGYRYTSNMTSPPTEIAAMLDLITSLLNFHLCLESCHQLWWTSSASLLAAQTSYSSSLDSVIFGLEAVAVCFLLELVMKTLTLLCLPPPILGWHEHQHFGLCWQAHLLPPRSPCLDPTRSSPAVADA